MNNVLLIFLNQKIALQRCLVEEIRGLYRITILSWPYLYEVHPDGIALLPASCKKYLEDLLSAIQFALPRLQQRDQTRMWYLC
jgi:hypothetical protein